MHFLGGAWDGIARCRFWDLLLVSLVWVVDCGLGCEDGMPTGQFSRLAVVVWDDFLGEPWQAFRLGVCRESVGPPVCILAFTIHGLCLS